MKLSFLHIIVVITLLLTVAGVSNISASENLVWPPAPDTARLEYIGQLKCSDLSPGGGFFQKLKRFIGGKEDYENLSLPYDMVVEGRTMYLICQGIPYFIEVNLDDNSFNLYTDKKHPIMFPISLCRGGDSTVYFTDGDNGMVYQFKDEKVTPFISDGLIRPTGIVAAPEINKIYIVDTGDHSLKIFDYDGQLLKTIAKLNDTTNLFHYPTFAARNEKGEILINDALNYEIKRFDTEGNLLYSFGQEGDGPGSFSRAKGVACDRDGHIYVMDNLFDNLQLFSKEGQTLLVVGQAGQQEGQFWSPSGIDIEDNFVYIADTYNNRIQILKYLGDPR